jgi:hypothetical protein
MLAAATNGGEVMAEAFAGTGRLSLERSSEIAAAPAAVWARVGRFGDMAWHPAIHATENPGGDNVGAVRVLTLGKAGGPTVTEELVEHSDEARRYAYRILAVDPAVLPVVNYVSEVAVIPVDGDGSLLRWRSSFDPAPGVADAAAVDAMAGVYTAGLEAAKRAIEG